mgnify:CR=1 FL=1
MPISVRQRQAPAVSSTPVKRAPGRRLQIFKALARDAEGLTAPQLRRKLNIPPESGQLGVILRGEMVAGRIRSETREGLEKGNDVVYLLTAKGRRHFQAGTIDSYAREHLLVAIAKRAISQ